MKVVKEFSNLFQAELAKDLLSQHGIISVVFDANMGGMGMYNVAIGGIKLMVADTGIEKAKDILLKDKNPL